MKKPIIAVTALFDDEKDSIWMLPAYLNAITDAGGIPVILPLIDNEEDIKVLSKNFDGFLLTGGQDINPKIYNEKKENYCGYINMARDTMEAILLGEILKSNKPILGICRGFQMLTSYLGGSLYQDLKVEKYGNKESNHRQGKPYNRLVHKIIIDKDSLLFDIIKKEEIMVNTLHHQGVKSVSSEVNVAGVTEDNLIESIYIKDKKFVLGVQWHPELLYKDFEDQRKIFNAFIENCNK